MKKNITIPKREKVSESDTWDLNKLYVSPEAWGKDFKKFQKMEKKISSFKGTLGKSAQKLKEFLDFEVEFGLFEERLGYYAHLRLQTDGGDSDHVGRWSRYVSMATKLAAEFSFANSELMDIPEAKIKVFLKAKCLKPYLVSLSNILRYRPHILSEKEEKLLTLQGDSAETAGEAFKALTDVDMTFPDVKTKDGKKPLSQGSYSGLIINQDRKVREDAYKKFYKVFEGHKNTLATLFDGSVKRDIYVSKVHNHPSVREQRLFADDVPVSVYDNLIKAVHKNIPALHKYYELKKKVLGLKTLKPWDVYAPMVSDIKSHHTYEEAVDKIISALEPLGEEYCAVLKKGLLEDRWVDRFENKGKRSGAFSSGSYPGNPYILMNYKEDVIRDVFTLAHEAGHSMHSWYSVNNNSFQDYNYTIFVAEVASTFNEQLLADYLLKNTDDKSMKIYLLNKNIDDIVATLYRQTMFAEFEKLSHEMVERGEALTVDSIRKMYRKLLEQYFGSSIKLEEVSDMECLRIPHFYNAFYVYKYATGLSAAIALSDKVLNGGDKERKRYLSFLKSGGSKFPIDQLKDAGVDMTTPAPVNNALKLFAKKVDELEKLLK